ESSALCRIGPDGDPICSGPGLPPRPLPWVSYVSADTTETTATVSFLTQHGPSIATITPGGGVAPYTDSAAATSHTATFSGLAPCTPYGYDVSLDGSWRYSGTFTTTCHSYTEAANGTRLLVVGPESFRSTLKPFVDHKNAHGMPAFFFS